MLYAATGDRLTVAASLDIPLLTTTRRPTAMKRLLLPFAIAVLTIPLSAQTEQEYNQIREAARLRQLEQQREQAQQERKHKSDLRGVLESSLVGKSVVSRVPLGRIATLQQGGGIDHPVTTVVHPDSGEIRYRADGIFGSVDVDKGDYRLTYFDRSEFRIDKVDFKSDRLELRLQAVGSDSAKLKLMLGKDWQKTLDASAVFVLLGRTLSLDDAGEQPRASPVLAQDTHSSYLDKVERDALLNLCSQKWFSDSHLEKCDAAKELEKCSNDRFAGQRACAAAKNVMDGANAADADLRRKEQGKEASQQQAKEVATGGDLKSFLSDRQFREKEVAPQPPAVSSESDTQTEQPTEGASQPESSAVDETPVTSSEPMTSSSSSARPAETSTPQDSVQPVAPPQTGALAQSDSSKDGSNSLFWVVFCLAIVTVVGWVIATHIHEAKLHAERQWQKEQQVREVEKQFEHAILSGDCPSEEVLASLAQRTQIERDRLPDSLQSRFGYFCTYGEAVQRIREIQQERESTAQEYKRVARGFADLILSCDSPFDEMLRTVRARHGTAAHVSFKNSLEWDVSRILKVVSVANGSVADGFAGLYQAIFAHLEPGIRLSKKECTTKIEDVDQQPVGLPVALELLNLFDSIQKTHLAADVADAYAALVLVAAQCCPDSRPVMLLRATYLGLLNPHRSANQSNSSGASSHSDGFRAGSPTTFEQDCELLDVGADFTAEELSEARRRKAKQWHSDLLQEMAPELKKYADGQLAQINAAYDRLKTKVKQKGKSATV